MSYEWPSRFAHGPKIYKLLVLDILFDRLNSLHCFGLIDCLIEMSEQTFLLVKSSSVSNRRRTTFTLLLLNQPFNFFPFLCVLFLQLIRLLESRQQFEHEQEWYEWREDGNEFEPDVAVILFTDEIIPINLNEIMIYYDTHYGSKDEKIKHDEGHG